MAPQFQYGLVRSGAGTPDPLWRKSTRSKNYGDCVEVGQGTVVIGVRDTKDNGHGPVLEFSRTEWAAFTERVRAA